MEFKFHWKNLEGIIPPFKDTLRKYRYMDTNIALVNIVETLNNQAPVHSSITKKNIKIIVGNII